MLGLIAVVFGSGMITEYKFHLASQVWEEKKQVAKAQKGQSEIIKFHQEASNVKKDKCFDAPIPADLNKLLR